METVETERVSKFKTIKKNKNLCSRDGRTVCGPQCVPKSTDAVSACRKVHNDNGTDGQTDGQTECDAICKYDR